MKVTHRAKLRHMSVIWAARLPWEPSFQAAVLSHNGSQSQKSNSELTLHAHTALRNATLQKQSFVLAQKLMDGAETNRMACRVGLVVAGYSNSKLAKTKLVRSNHSKTEVSFFAWFGLLG